VKVGDLVKRTDVWVEWMKHNSWITTDEVKEIGIVTDIERKPGKEHWLPDVFTFVVHWSHTGLSWEGSCDIVSLDEDETW